MKAKNKTQKKTPVSNAVETAPKPTNGDDLKEAVNWLLGKGIFTKLRLHGNVTWTGLALVRLAIFWMWVSETGLVDAANFAIKLVRKLYGSAAVGSYEALTNALIRYTPQLLPKVWSRIHTLSQEQAGKLWRVGIWFVLGVDGSRVSVPRTAANEKKFCQSNKKKKTNAKKTNAKKKKRAPKRSRHAGVKRATERRKSHYDPQPVGPQMWLTLVWHIGLRLPWCWKVGPSFDSERAHLLSLLEEQDFPERTLFCGDAGFYGYDFWQGIRKKEHHHFLVRVGSNVRLLKNLGHVQQRNDIVFCWPNKQMQKKQPPLVLRLFRFRDGRGEVYLVSSVLDEEQLSAQQASEIYRARWGIELQFRALKQTYGRSKLRSRTPEHDEIELHWSLVALTALQLLAIKNQKRLSEPAEKTSIAAVLSIVRSMIGESDQSRAACQSLPQRLAGATTDTYKRHSKKKSRNYPRRKQEPSAGPPHIISANTKQKNALLSLEDFTLAV
jgi:IS4 transposase